MGRQINLCFVCEGPDKWVFNWPSHVVLHLCLSLLSELDLWSVPLSVRSFCQKFQHGYFWQRGEINCHLLGYIEFHGAILPENNADTRAVCSGAEARDDNNSWDTDVTMAETAPNRWSRRQRATKQRAAGSVSERRQTGSGEADSCRRLRSDICGTGCHWARCVRVLPDAALHYAPTLSQGTDAESNSAL